VSARGGASFSAARIAARVAVLGREITRECDGRRLDVVVTLDRGFVFAADLIRQIGAPVVCHFVREDVRDVEQAGYARREFLFRSFSCAASARASPGRFAWPCCSINRQGAVSAWSPITSASGLHLRIYGLVTAWPRPMVRDAISGSFPPERGQPPRRAANAERNRLGDALFV
jgi:hypothetical protein